MGYETLIRSEELFEHLGDPDWTVVDCRFSLQDTSMGARAFREGHIPGAVYAHLDHDLSGPVVGGVTGRHPLPEPDRFSERLSGWGIDGRTQVVAYDDRAGAVAARLWWMLKWLGHDAAAVLDGGWARWTAAGGPASDLVQEPARRDFQVRLRSHLLASTSLVQEVRQDPSYRLIDAREELRFRGEQEPIDPVAGHIPGAVSLPYLENLSPSGLFLQPRQLRSRFEPVLGPVPAGRVICYCGSGVTAAHHLLALAHAGFGHARLYAGSWSEWILDPERPVASAQ